MVASGEVNRKPGMDLRQQYPAAEVREGQLFCEILGSSGRS
jgi:hypothetical protein